VSEKPPFDLNALVQKALLVLLAVLITILTWTAKQLFELNGHARETNVKLETLSGDLGDLEQTVIDFHDH
jgi:hypothetical protein